MAKIAAITAACAIGLVPVAAPAIAQQSSEPQQPEYAPTMLVLDASGSMLAADPGGGTKMDAAKTAVRTFVAAAPEASTVGLTVYGTETGNSDAEKDAGCRDVRILQPAETIDRSALTSAVDQITPRGYTPIGESLRRANDALPKGGAKSIVLVSDGLDTCTPPDPCEVARELEAQGTDLVVHAIGFGVDDPSRAQLTCIAQSTGGTYTDAVDGKSLEQALPRVSAAALRNYAAIGTPIEGTPDYQSAPVAAPGQYLDVIGHKQPRYYAVDVPDGATAYFTGTISFPRHDGDWSSVNRIDLKVFGTDGSDCGVTEKELTGSADDGVALTVSTVWDGAAEPSSGGNEACYGGGRYYFTLEWGAVSEGVPAQLPLEISVGVESAVSDPGAPAVSEPVEFTAPTGPVVPVVGGGSFNVAATLPGSGRFTDTVQRGEFVFYRVRLDWGQGLSYRVRFGETPGRGSDNVSNVETTLYSPYRAEIDSDTGAYGGSEQVLPSGKELATAPVRYLNREEGGKLVAQSVAGWYYISVKAGQTVSPEKRAAPVPVELELTVTGDPEPGPQYRNGTGETFGKEGKSARATDRDEVSAGADSGDDGGVPAVVWVATALGVAVIAAVVVLVLLLRRRTTR
ncbi:VWA domain-containing protein [Nocardia cyriacigeorgica]|uniref:VWA domain-containing protein n=1 Tax=Nocardia cyriacigeorgica TaxID=135487 RepID=A0A6P1D064_9NOCA|nr:VWA domain-containing protein [Nocardia cyriacigeorgica]NEW42984.1 VWA domain-containing protein [Nocardia cyriacigeorgica]NEW53293.1 VWA domain-containing protein [Nocardia cyriacigeorgica]NEW55452.1 VWA domain-containing protein [Nocardia cyriacigeorgica]